MLELDLQNRTIERRLSVEQSQAIRRNFSSMNDTTKAQGSMDSMATAIAIAIVVWRAVNSITGPWICWLLQRSSRNIMEGNHFLLVFVKTHQEQSDYQALSLE